MTYDVVGIDVSRYQASADGAVRFNWAKAAPKIYFAILRAGVGVQGVDYQFYYNLQECKRLGIPFGIYHAIKADKDPKKQGDAFAELSLDKDGKKVCPLEIWLDCEDSADRTKQALQGVYEKIKNRFFSRTGFDATAAGIYTRASFWDVCLPRMDWPKALPLWVAHYGAAAPALPKDWVGIKNPAAWLYWQYSCKGDGCAFGSAGDGDIDLDYFNGSLADFNRRYGLSVKPLAEREQPAEGPVTHVKVRTKTNLRSRPVLEPASDIGDLSAGSRLQVLEDSGDFWRVEGYAWKKNTEPCG